jgi:hypothetical protein
MKPDAITRLGVVLATAGLVFIGARGQSLIRKDLLKEKPGEIAPPRRDIFSPRTAYAPPGFSQPGEFPDGRVTDAGMNKTLPESESAETSLDLSYIGYVQSAHKMIALVILEGQAMAVSEGEEVLPGVKVEKVAPDRIDLIGPDAKRSSFPLQGEQP